MSNRVPIYKSGAYDYAREHGETQQLRASLDANRAVQDYLRNDISKYYVGGERFNATQLMQDLKREFGLDRAMHVLLASVHDWDGRFSRATVERAKAEFYISTKTDNNPGDFEKDFCYTDMHPVYLDEVIKKGLQMEREIAQIRENTANVKSFDDFKIGETYLNHNESCYTILDKGMTYFDEPFIKVQLVTNQPDFDWTVWAVRPEIIDDGTLEWAYSKERDMTLPPVENILTEENQMESINVTATMTALMNGKSTNNLVGFATVTVGDSYAISNIAVFASNNPKYQNPYYSSMPDIKEVGEGYHPIVFTTPEAREAINKAVSGAMIAAAEQGKGMDNRYPSSSSELTPKKNARDVSAVIKGELYDGNVKANTNVTLYGHIEVKGVKLMTSREGNDFAAMPQRYGSDNKYHDLVFPITKEAREALQGELTARLEQRDRKNDNTPDITDVQNFIDRAGQSLDRTREMGAERS
jgi:DNA-binding cell septation regulator SpoVG